jgi:CxxC-x17-CxxC domain-containing protein
MSTAPSITTYARHDWMHHVADLPDALRAHGLGLHEWATLMVIARHASEDGKCWLAHETIERESMQSERTVYAAIKSLKTQGLLRTTQGRGHYANSYELDLHPVQGCTLCRAALGAASPAPCAVRPAPCAVRPAPCAPQIVLEVVPQIEPEVVPHVRRDDDEQQSRKMPNRGTGDQSPQGKAPVNQVAAVAKSASPAPKNPQGHAALLAPPPAQGRVTYGGGPASPSTPASPAAAPSSAQRAPEHQPSSAPPIKPGHTAVTCAYCGQSTTVPYVPTDGRPNYCYACYEAGNRVEVKRANSAPTPPPKPWRNHIDERCIRLGMDI